jgi:Leucine-rich repeat (LRR) protein
VPSQLPLWLSKLQKLETLHLVSSRITGSIPTWLATLPRLFYLHLSHKLISGECPKELCSMPPLVSVEDLGENSALNLPFLGRKIGSFAQFNILSNVQPTIFVANNSLHGNIPVEISRLKLLNQLDFSHKSFSSNIPNQISELTNLERLDLSANQLSDEIQASLTCLHFLSHFSVAYNNLHGPIPQGTQLQSFGASAYEGNPGLCGLPLLECAHIVTNNGGKDIQNEERQAWIAMVSYLCGSQLRLWSFNF